MGVSQSQVMPECQNSSLSNITETAQDDTPGAQLERLVYYYAMDVALPIVCAIGIVGNILNLMVLTREKIHQSLTKMEKSAHIGLIALAVSDLMFCLLALLFSVMPSQATYTEMNIVLYYDWLGPSFITVFIITSTWLTVVMAGERYVAVCHPFKARKLISLRRTRITISLIYGICISATIPLLFERVVNEKKCAYGPSVYAIERRQEFSDSVIGIRRLVWAILFDFIPCIALLYFNSGLIWKIHKAKKIRRAMAPMQKEGVLLTKHPRELFSYTANNSADHLNTRSSTTSNLHVNNVNYMNRSRSNHGGGTSPMASSPNLSYMRQSAANSKNIKARRKHTDSALNSVTATLVAVVILFLILVSPSEVLKFSYTITKQSSSHAYKIIRSITNLMQAVNFSVNFVLYCAVNKSFRSSLAGIFCFCKTPPRLQLPSFDRAYCHATQCQESSS